MKILRLEYEEQTTGWKLNPVTWGNLTLLVGVSGVGKTKIVNVINNLREIAMGGSLNGVKWSIEFEVAPGKNYLWKGHFDRVEGQENVNAFRKRLGLDRVDSSKNRKYKILAETLELAGEKIAERKADQIVWKNQSVPKLSDEISLLEIFKEEEDVAVARDGFIKVLDSHRDLQSLGLVEDDLLDILVALATDENEEWSVVKDSNVSIFIKMAAAQSKNATLFSEIKRRFIDIFPQVEDLRIVLSSVDFLKTVSNKTFTFFDIQIKEQGNDHWLWPVSAGMAKALYYLGCLSLCPAGTVLLIDEFENSLGVNCIDVLTEEVLDERDDMQFIITSHHPYIINNISPEYWKIVTRHGGVVEVRDAAAGAIGESHLRLY
jgi:predicted ATPase